MAKIIDARGSSGQVVILGDAFALPTSNSSTFATNVPIVAGSMRFNPDTNQIEFINASTQAWTGIATTTGGTSAAATFNNSGSGAASGAVFNGSNAVTISYNTVGAQPYDSTLAALAALNWSAGTQVVSLTGLDTFTLKTVGNAVGNILDVASGNSLYQGLNSNLTAYAGANWSSGTQIPALTAANTITLKTIGNAVGNILDKASADTLYQPLGSASGLARLIAFFFTTTPSTSEVLGLYVAADPFTIAANMVGTQVKVGTNPSATFAIDVQQNGTSIGTISIATTGTPTLTTVGGTAKAIAIGDVIKFVGPSTADTTIANVAVNVLGKL